MSTALAVLAVVVVGGLLLLGAMLGMDAAERLARSSPRRQRRRLPLRRVGEQLRGAWPWWRWR